MTGRQYRVEAAIATAIIVIGGAILALVFDGGFLARAFDRAPNPPTTYDYEQITFCLTERGFPYSTLADAKKDLRFCIGFDQDVRR